MYVTQLHTASPGTGETHRERRAGLPRSALSLPPSRAARTGCAQEELSPQRQVPTTTWQGPGLQPGLPALLATLTPNLGQSTAWPWGLTLSEDPAAPHPGRVLPHPFQKPGCRVRGGACLGASSATSIQTWHRPGPAPGVGQPAAGSGHGEGLSLGPREKRGFWGPLQSPPSRTGQSGPGAGNRLPQTWGHIITKTAGRPAEVDDSLPGSEPCPVTALITW